MTENFLKTNNNKKKSNIECYPKFIDEGFKKLFLKKMKGKLKNNHASLEKKDKVPNIMKSMVIQPLHKKQSQPHRSRTKDLRTLSPLGTNTNHNVTDERDNLNTIDNHQTYYTKSETTNRQNFHLRELHASTINDNISVSKKQPLNLDFIKFKYNSCGNINENRNTYLDNFKSYCLQLKLKMQINDEDSFNEEKQFPETDRNHLKRIDSISSYDNSKEIIKLINNLKQSLEKQQNYNNQLLYTANAIKQNKGRNSTPLKDRTRNGNMGTQKNRKDSTKDNLPDEKEDPLMESLEKIKDYVEITEKKLSDLKYYHKSTTNYLLKQVSEITAKEKKYVQEIKNIQTKYRVLLQEYQIDNKNEPVKSGEITNENQNVDNNKDKISKNSLNRYSNKIYPPFNSYILLLKQLGIDQSIFFKGSEFVNIQDENLNDHCDCYTYDDHKCGQDNVPKWNINIFLENSKLRSFLEMLSEKINHENSFRMIIEDKLVQGKLKPLATDTSEPKHKIFSRIPKQINNMSTISWVKSDTGKEINDIKEDSILKEI